MKKFILLAAITALTASCGDDIHENYYECPENHLVSTTEYHKVRQGAWESTQDNMWLVGLDIPAINDEVLQRGVVLVYFIDNNDQLLPYVRTYYDDQNDIAYTEMIRHEVYQGGIDIYIQNSDLQLPVNPNTAVDPLEFKVVIIKNIYH